MITSQVEAHKMNVELTEIAGTSLEISCVAIGTWAIGGWMWGGTDEAKSVATIRAAVEQGINIIDTAPVYGFGRSEQIVGNAIADGHLCSEVLIATKTGLEWKDGRVFRNASRVRILQEVEDSLRRLRTDQIDIYQVHWPAPLVRIEETAEAMHTLFKQGKIRAIGVSNFSVGQMERFRRVAPLHVLQPPYNLFERGIEADILPYCHNNKIATLGYGALCHGLLFGRMRPDTFSMVTICAAPIQNFSSPGSRNILPPWNGSTGSRSSGSACRVIHLRSVGCSIKVSLRRCGARASPVSCSPSTR